MIGSDAQAFAAHESIRGGEFDAHLDTLAIAINDRLTVLGLTDREAPPKRPLPPGQVWAWMNGPGRPHWAVRWTGAVLR